MARSVRVWLVGIFNRSSLVFARSHARRYVAAKARTGGLFYSRRTIGGLVIAWVALSFQLLVNP